MNKTKTNSQDRREQVSIGQIKLAIDVHASCYVVVRQLDGDNPQPAQRFSPEGFLSWVKKQVRQAEQVYSCYEAGCFGFVLHRQLEALGVKNVVVRPKKMDDYGKRVRTDKSDAHGLCQDLDRYVAGNKRAFCVVRVPTVQEEISRSQSRLREGLRKNRQRLEAQGRSLFLYYGHRISGQWWKQARWEKEKGKLPAELLEYVENLRRSIEVTDQELGKATRAIEKAAPQHGLIFGCGRLTQQSIEREIEDWKRFKNRRAVASLTGMVPSEETSQDDRRQGSITKHGNPRLRRLLIEMAWRMVLFQPDYEPVRHWNKVLGNPKAGSGQRKKAIVAVGRRLVIDLWRINTGRCQPQDVGLKMHS